MKVQIARIRLYLKTGKKLSDGTSPIMLSAAFNGKKEISTGYSCLPKYWDKKQMAVKKGFKNWLIINDEIQKQYDAAIARRNEYERNGERYTAEMLLSKKEVLNANNLEISALISQYYDENPIKQSTKYTWTYLLTLLHKYTGNDKLTLVEIDEAFVKKFVVWCKANNKGDGVIRTILSKLAALFNFAIQRDMINKTPFKKYRYSSVLKKSNSLVYVPTETVQYIKKVFLNEIKNHNTYCDMLDIRSEIFPLALWLFIYRFNGMAPVDIAHIEKKDMKIINVRGNKYWSLSTARIKTGKSVEVRIKIDDEYNDLLVGTYMKSNNSEYVLPILNGYKYKAEETRKQRVKRVCSGYCGKGLKQWWIKINEMIKKENLDIPTIPTEATFYSARHSFAVAYLSQPNANLLALATLLGRSIDTISTYAKSLNEDINLIQAVEGL